MNRAAKTVLLALGLALGVWYVGIVPLHRAQAQPALVTWDIKTTVVNPDTDLRKIYAVSNTDGVEQSFFAKGVMETADDQKKIWDNIWAQYVSVQIKPVDTMSGQGKTDLEGRTI